MMKRLNEILFMMSALLAAACGGQEDEPQVEEMKQPVAVSFSATTPAGMEGVTRTAAGSITGNAGLQGVSLGVSAALHGVHTYDSSNVSADFMWNQLVSYDDGSDAWTYSPLKTWPAGDGTWEGRPYLTFYAYAPYSQANGADKASKCITEFSGNNEQGDPWLTYQLGGTKADWKDHQVDLLYAFTKDQRNEGPYARVQFTFRHALATAGDKVTLTCGDLLKTRMATIAKAKAKELKLFIDSMTLSYSLVPKARLVLNSADSPNWQPINSGDATVERTVTVEPASPFQVASFTPPESYVQGDTSFTTDQGIFYIPIDVDGMEQTVRITIGYRVTLDGANYYSGSLSTTGTLTGQGMAGLSQGIRLNLGDNLPLFY